MRSTSSDSARRKLARLAVAGAITAIPLTALAVPAAAEVTLEPEVTEVSRPHWQDRNPWDPRYPWENRNPWDNPHDHGRWHDHDRWRDHDRWDRDCDHNDWNRGHDPFRNPFRHALPRGVFGSS
ncbi:Uncharacterised protein [Nocardia otitidiscaviarum]|uniref:Secreted protein n=1 Tax=Nocardia otitidiscaviarum TaxID=1823 RepID=A0A378YP89_9NOCA|nr:hypothetical protein [Nocardia otitidiscaviarum]SUA78976.1 Uncharacterised protein [Nocardia otitidiscaviarum]